MMRYLAPLLFAVVVAACATPASPPRPAAAEDVLDYVVGASALWPRHGDPNHHQHQNLEPSRVCWTKYTLGWSFECWRWDEAYVYHQVDHAIDGARRWEFYTFSDGRWLPRRMTPGVVWTLDVANEVHWYDADCAPLPPRPATYRVRAWLAGALDAGGDLGRRDVLMLEYQPDASNGSPDSIEHFYFAKGAGWYRWTRGAAGVTFNRLGGVARPPTPLCARDFQG
jgi:hypothetical protein